MITKNYFSVKMINLREIRNNKFCVAVAGATDNKDKFGFKIFSYLKKKGFNVFPVNNKKKNILGMESYASVSELSRFLSERNESIFLVDMVVPPKSAVDIVNEVIKCNVKRIWFQPGSESDEAMKICKKNGIEFVSHSCIMEESKKRNTEFKI